MSSAKVFIILADGFEEIEALTPVDVLRRAKIDVNLVTINNTKTVTGAHNVQVLADYLFSEVDFTTGDMIYLPGGAGYKLLNQHSGLQQVLKDYYTNNKYIVAICAAPVVLHTAGLLQNKTVTCYPGFESKLSDAKTVSGKQVEVDDKILTGNGPGAAFALSKELVKHLVNEQIAEQLQNGMCFKV